MKTKGKQRAKYPMESVSMWFTLNSMIIHG